MGDLLQQYHGQIDAETTLRQITARFQTGDMVYTCSTGPIVAHLFSSIAYCNLHVWQKSDYARSECCALCEWHRRASVRSAVCATQHERHLCSKANLNKRLELFFFHIFLSQMSCKANRVNSMIALLIEYVANMCERVHTAPGY